MDLMNREESLERRRLQNRIAQRRFRQKHSQKTTHTATTTPTTTTTTTTTNSTPLERHINSTPSSAPLSRSDPSVQIHHNAWSDTINTPTIPTSPGPPPSSLPSVGNTNTPAIARNPAHTIYNLGLCNAMLDNVKFGEVQGISLPDAPPGWESVLSDLSTNPEAIRQIEQSHHHTRADSASSSAHRGHSRESSSGPSVATISTNPSPGGSASSTTGKGAGWMSTLHIAAQKGHDSIVRVLLQYITDCNERDSDGLTAMMHAIINGHENVVALLLDHGADPGIVDNRRRAALHWAVCRRHEGVLRILLEHFSRNETLIEQINSYDDTIRTPLHVAVDLGFEAGVTLLLQFGANLHCRARKLDAHKIKD